MEPNSSVDNGERRLSHSSVERLSIGSDIIPLTPKSSFKKIKDLTEQVYGFLDFREQEKLCSMCHANSNHDGFADVPKADNDGQVLLLMDLQKENAELKGENNRLNEELKHVRKEFELQAFRKQQELEKKNAEILNLRKDKEEFQYRETLTASRHNRKLEELSNELAKARSACKNSPEYMSEQHKVQFIEFQNEISELKKELQLNSEKVVLFELYKEKAEAFKSILDDTLQCMEEIAVSVTDLMPIDFPVLDLTEIMVGANNVELNNEWESLPLTDSSFDIDFVIPTNYDDEILGEWRSFCNELHQLRAAENRELKCILDSLQAETKGSTNAETVLLKEEVLLDCNNAVKPEGPDSSDSLYVSVKNSDSLMADTDVDPLIKFSLNFYKFLVENEIIAEDEVNPDDINMVYMLADKYVNLLDLYLQTREQLEKALTSELKEFGEKIQAVQKLETTLINSSVLTTDSTVTESDLTEPEISMVGLENVTLSRDPLEMTKLGTTPILMQTPRVMSLSSAKRPRGRVIFQSPNFASPASRRQSAVISDEYISLKNALQRLGDEKKALENERQQMAQHHADSILKFEQNNKELSEEVATIRKKLTVEIVNLKPSLQPEIEQTATPDLLQVFFKCIMERCLTINEARISKMLDEKIEIEKKLRALENQRDELQEALKSSEAGQQSLDELCSTLRGEKTDLSRKLTSLDLQVKEISKKHETILEENRKLTEQLNDITKMEKELRLKAENDVEAVERLNDKLTALTRELAETNREKSLYTSQLQSAESLAGKMETQLKTLNDEKADLSEKLVTQEREMSEIIKNVSSENNELSRKFETVSAEKNRLQQALFELEKENKERGADEVASVKELSVKICRQNEQLIKLSSEISQYENKLQQAEMNTKNMTDHNTDLKEQLRRVLEDNQRNEGLLEILNKEKKDLMENIEALESQRKNIREKLDCMSADYNELKEKVECLSSEKNELQTALTDIEKKVCLKYESRDDTFNRKISELKVNNEILCKQLIELENMNQALQRTIDELSDKLSLVINEKVLINSENAALKDENNRVTSVLAVIIEEVNQVKAETEGEMEHLGNSIKLIADCLSAYNGEHETIINAEKEHLLSEIASIPSRLAPIKSYFTENEHLFDKIEGAVNELSLTNELLTAENGRVTDALTIAHSVILSTKEIKSGLTETVESYAMKLEEIYSRNKMLKDEIERLERQNQHSVETAADHFQIAVKQLEKELESLRTEKMHLEEKLLLASKHNALFEKELCAIKQELGCNKETVLQLNAELEEMKEERNKVQFRYENLEKELKLTEKKYKKEVDNLLVQLEKDNADSVKKEKELIMEKEKCMDEKKVVEQNLMLSAKEVNNLENTLKKLTADCAKVSNDKLEIEKEVDALRRQMKQEKKLLADRDNMIVDLELKVKELDDRNEELQELFGDIQKALGLPQEAILQATADSSGRKKFRVARDGMIAGLDSLKENTERLKIEVERLTSEKIQFEIKTASLEQFGRNQEEQAAVLSKRLAALEDRETKSLKPRRSENFSSRRMDRLEELNTMLSDTISQIVEVLRLPNKNKLNFLSIRGGEATRKMIIDAVRAAAEAATKEESPCEPENFSSRRMDRLEELNNVLSDMMNQIVKLLRLPNINKLNFLSIRGGEASRKGIIEAVRVAAEAASKVESLQAQIVSLDEENQQLCEDMKALLNDNNALGLKIYDLEKKSKTQSMCLECSEMKMKYEEQCNQIKEWKATESKNRLLIGKLEEETELQKEKIQELLGVVERKEQQILRLTTTVDGTESAPRRDTELREKVRSLNKTNDTLKELCRARAQEIKLLKNELKRLQMQNSRESQSPLKALNSNQLNSPIRERGYTLRTRTDVAANYKRAIRAHTDGRENPL